MIEFNNKLRRQLSEKGTFDIFTTTYQERLIYE